MAFKISYTNNNEILLARKTAKILGSVFLIFGLSFEVILTWIIWSFFDITDPLAEFWLTIGQTWIIPISSFILVLGGGCIVIGLIKLGLNESIVIKKEIKPNISGIQLIRGIFFLKRKKLILSSNITGLKMYTIPLDELKMFMSYRLELIYKNATNSEQTTLSTILYQAEGSLAASDTLRLGKSIHNLLNLPFDLEKVETAPSAKDYKKIIKVIDFDQGI